MIKYEEEIKKMNICEKICQISSEIEYLQKDDKVGFGNNAYKAISIEKVMSAVAEKMNKYGVIIFPIEQEYKRQDEEVTKKDGSIGINRISDVNVKYSVINIHNPLENIEVVSSGTGVDTQDKGVGKAMTYAYKNMIIKLFAIATGDDTDKVHSDDYTRKLKGESKPQNKKVLNDAQVKRLYAIASSAGYTTEDVKTHMKAKFNIISVKDLSKQQYDTMCEGYEKLKK